MKKLPIGIQNFSEIIQGGYLYIDKTKHIFNLLESGKYYFLSRPRRFGKSLLLSTIKEIFEGNKTLFKGLWIENQWDWTKRNPVIHFSFNNLDYKNQGLNTAIDKELHRIAHQYDLTLREETISQKFRELIKELGESKKVVVLIDEYDKPIIDYLGIQQEKALENRAILREFYSIIKNSDTYLEFFLITGVSKFSQTSIFSNLNHLLDLTLAPDYATLTGYTQQELLTYFDEHLNAFPLNREELLKKIKLWYNGYSWDGENFVYNPFSVLSFFQVKKFRNYWFASGTPTFLINLLKQRNFYKIERKRVGYITLDSYDLEDINLTTLLFQTGYLTIKVEAEEYVILDYPNKEVESSMYQYLIGAFAHSNVNKALPLVLQLQEAFTDNDLTAIIAVINGLFKSIPAPIFIKGAESYYHSLIHLMFNYLGIYLQSEVHTSDGRIDAVVQTEHRIFIFEFKVDKSAEIALRQIHEKQYPQKYLPTEKEIVLIGVNFGSKEKGVEAWKSELFKN